MNSGYLLFCFFIGLCFAGKFSDKDDVIVGEVTHIYQGESFSNAFSNNEFGVVWRKATTKYGPYDIMVQLYNKNGEPKKEPFRVNVYDDKGKTTFGRTPQLTEFGNDNSFAVVWSHSGKKVSDTGVYARYYNFKGEPLDIKFRVNEEKESSKVPKVALLKDKKFVVVWEYYDSGYSIKGRIFDQNGKKIGNEFNYTLENVDQRNAAVAPLSDGGFVLTFDCQKRTIPQTTKKYVILQRYSGSGDRVSPSVEIFKDSEGTLENPTVAELKNGDIIAAFDMQTKTPTFKKEIVVQIYDSNLNTKGSNFTTEDKGVASYPSIAVQDDGNYIISWTCYESGLGTNIIAQEFVNNQGKEAFRINIETGAQYREFMFSVFNDGRILTSWQRTIWNGLQEDPNLSYTIFTKLFGDAKDDLSINWTLIVIVVGIMLSFLAISLLVCVLFVLVGIGLNKRKIKRNNESISFLKREETELPPQKARKSIKNKPLPPKPRKKPAPPPIPKKKPTPPIPRKKPNRK